MEPIQWKDIYINGQDTGYDINIEGIVKGPEGVTKDPQLHVGKKVYKIDPLRTAAKMFLENPAEHQSARNWGRLEWYTDREVLQKALEIELEFWHSRTVMKDPEIDRVRRACELMENPEIRLVFVAGITGISKRDLYLLRMGDKWNDIAKDYIFPINNYSHADPKYTVSQIHEVCEMLTRRQTFRHIFIERQTGVNPYTIDQIRFRKSYQAVSMFYEFCSEEVDHNKYHDLGMFTAHQIRQACYMLENPSYSIKLISEFCNMNKSILYKIKEKKIFTEISKDFDVNVNRMAGEELPYTERVIYMIQQGVPNPEIVSRIQLEYNIADRRKVQLSVGDIKHRYFSVNCSTTRTRRW